MSKCPCEECITYAMCNARLKEMTRPEICVLAKEVDCKVLISYINLLDQFNIRHDRINRTRIFFNLEPVNSGKPRV